MKQKTSIFLLVVLAGSMLVSFASAQNYIIGENYLTGTNWDDLNPEATPSPTPSPTPAPTDAPSGGGGGGGLYVTPSPAPDLSSPAPSSIPEIIEGYNATIIIIAVIIAIFAVGLLLANKKEVNRMIRT